MLVNDSKIISNRKGYELLKIKNEEKSFLQEKIVKSFLSENELNELITRYEKIRYIEPQGILRLIRLNEINNLIILDYENFDGILLKDFIKSFKNQNIKLYLNIFLNITKCLEKLHDFDFFHGILRPDNILIDIETNEIKINYICFNYDYAEIEHQDLNSCLYALKYISPEQSRRINVDITFKTDFYSLGIIFYELITGLTPFDSQEKMSLIHSHLTINPKSPSLLNNNIPNVVSELILKLISKNPNNRYSSVKSLKSDLEALVSFDNFEMKNFVFDSDNIRLNFKKSSKIYGRSNEIKDFLDFFYNNSYNVKILLVSGESGIGKTSLIKKIQSTYIISNYNYISIKFELINNDYPYFELINALKTIIFNDLLYNLDEKLNILLELKKHLMENLNSVFFLIPELKEYFLEQNINIVYPNKKHDFITTIISLIEFISKEKKEFIMFLDDLQWADSNTLKILSLIIKKDLNNLTLIVTYRNNNINDSLESFIHNIPQNIYSKFIILNKLYLQDIKHFLSDLFLLENNDCLTLSKIIESKTKGIPLFIEEFIQHLISEKILFYDIYNSKWSLYFKDLLEIKYNNELITKNLSNKISYIPDFLKDILKKLSCFGTKFSFQQLKILFDDTEKIGKELVIAINEGILIQIDDYFYFSHDKVYESLSLLLSRDEKELFHYNIGKSLLEDYINHKECDLFKVAYHLNIGFNFIKNFEEKNICLDLFSNVAKISKAMNSYKLAIKYFNNCLKLIDKNSWKLNYKETYKVYLETSEAYILNNNIAEAENLFSEILNNSKSESDRLELFQTQMILYITINNTDKAFEIGKKALSILNTSIPENNFKLLASNTILSFYVKKKLNKIGIKNIESLVIMDNLNANQIMKILENFISISYIANPKVLSYVILKMVFLSLKYGNMSASSYGYVMYGLLLIKDKRYHESFEIGQIALKLLRNSYDTNLTLRTKFIYAVFITPWVKPIRENLDYLISNINHESGYNITSSLYRGYSIFHYILRLYIAGENIDTLITLTKSYFEFISQTKNNFISSVYYIRLQSLLSLKGFTKSYLDFSNEEISESDFIQTFNDGKTISGLFYYYISKLELAFIYNDYTQALVYSNLSEKYLGGVTGHFIETEYYFYKSLNLIALYKKTDDYNQKININFIKKTITYFNKLKNICPNNFEHKFFLLNAEFERINLNNKLATDFYTKSIEKCIEYGYINNQALFLELFANHILNLNGFDKSKDIFYKSINLYKKWGAKLKENELLNQVKKLELKFNEKTKDVFNIKKNTNNFHIDYEYMLKTLQVISQESSIENLLKNLINFMIENSGADKISIIMEKENKLFIESDYNTNNGFITFLESIDINNYNNIPKTIINYVFKNKVTLIESQIKEKDFLYNDPYLKFFINKSILCFPIINLRKSIGVIYLENSLIENLFSIEKIKILEFLASNLSNIIEKAFIYSKLDDYSKSLEIKVQQRTLELKEKNLELKKLYNFLQQLTSNLSHDLKVPLNSCSNVIKIFNIKNKDRDNIEKEIVDNTMIKIDNYLKKINEYINICLDHEMIDCGKIILHKEYINLNKLLIEILQIYQDLISRKEIKLLLEIPEQNITLFNDKVRLEIIISNLISNALKYCEEKIVISISFNYDMLTICISNDGQKINKEIRPIIFERHIKDNYKSTGLGLFICKQYISIMKGQIWFEDKDLTSFYIKIPIIEE